MIGSLGRADTVVRIHGNALSVTMVTVLRFDASLPVTASCSATQSKIQAGASRSTVRCAAIRARCRRPRSLGKQSANDLAESHALTSASHVMEAAAGRRLQATMGSNRPATIATRSRSSRRAGTPTPRLRRARRHWPEAHWPTMPVAQRTLPPTAATRGALLTSAAQVHPTMPTAKVLGDPCVCVRPRPQRGHGCGTNTRHLSKRAFACHSHCPYHFAHHHPHHE